jgi:hypothetical protein
LRTLRSRRYCKHEGDDDEIWSRLELFHDKFFGPMIVRCSKEPAISKEHAELVRYMGRAFETVRGWWQKKTPHGRKAEELDRAGKWTTDKWEPNVTKASGALEGLYGREYVPVRT